MEPEQSFTTPPTHDQPTEQPATSMRRVEPLDPEPSDPVTTPMVTPFQPADAGEASEASQASEPLADTAAPTTPETTAPASPVAQIVTPSEPVILSPEIIAPTVPTEPAAAPIPEASVQPAVIPPATTPAATVPAETGPFVGGDPIGTPIPANPTTSKRGWLKPVLIVAGVIVTLGLVTTGVYAAIIVPNKPANVLMAAVENSVQQKQVSFKGTVNLDSSSTATKVAITGSQDNTKQASDIQLNITSSGISLPVEARFVDQNAYLKVSDLTPIVDLLSTFGGGNSASATYTNIGKQLSNKWISIDSTLIKQAGASCLTDTKWGLTQTDVRLLENQYKLHPFTTIQSTTSDTVNGQQVTKFQLSIDDDQAVTYANSLGNLSVIQALSKCSKDAKTSSPNVGSSLRDHDKTPITIWVNKSTKQIVQIASQSTAHDAQTGVKGSGQISFSYAPVSITAPTDSTPALEVLANVEKTLGIPSSTSSSAPDLTGLLGGILSGSSAGSGSQTQSADVMLKTNVVSLQTQLEAFYQSHGYYPTLAEINSASWRAANMSGLDPTALEGASSGAQSLAGAPAKGVIAYQAVTGAKAPCTKSTTCASYTLTATLSDGTLYTKSALD